MLVFVPFNHTWNPSKEQEQTGYGTDRSMDGDLSEEQGFFISSAQEDRTSREHSTMSRVLDDLGEYSGYRSNQTQQLVRVLLLLEGGCVS